MSTTCNFLCRIENFFDTYSAPIIGWFLSSMTQLVISRLKRDKLAIKEYLDIIGAYFAFDKELSSTKIKRLKVAISRKNKVCPSIFPVKHRVISKLLETYWLSDQISTEQKFAFPKQLLRHAEKFILNDSAVNLRELSFKSNVLIDTLIFVLVGIVIMLIVFVSSGARAIHISLDEIIPFTFCFIFVSFLSAFAINAGYYFLRIVKNYFFDNK